jgi:hypothetical protein
LFGNLEAGFLKQDGFDVFERGFSQLPGVFTVIQPICVEEFMRFSKIANMQFEGVYQRPSGNDCLQRAPGYAEFTWIRDNRQPVVSFIHISSIPASQKSSAAFDAMGISKTELLIQRRQIDIINKR